MITFSISLPTQIAEKIDGETQRRGFASRSEFIRSLLRAYFVESEEVKLEEFTKKPLSQIKLELAKSGKYSERFIQSVTEGLSKSSAYEDKAS